jgi:copper chaperone NosL
VNESVSAAGAHERNAPVGQQSPWQSRYRLPTALFVVACALLVTSILFPWWHMRLNAPQYPRGLDLTVYIDHVEGDIREIDGLNHYIGMKKLSEAASFERGLSLIALGAMVLLILATAFVHRKWFAPLTLPALLLPLVFLADMYYWLWNYGHTLNPTAALSGAIKPFTPALLGHGTIGQFSTDAWLMLGFWLACGASVLIILGLHFRRQARRAAARGAGGAPAGAAA